MDSRMFNKYLAAGTAVAALHWMLPDLAGIDPGTAMVLACSNLFCLLVGFVVHSRGSSSRLAAYTALYLATAALVWGAAGEPLLFSVFSVLVAGTFSSVYFLGYTLIIMFSAIVLSHYWLLASVLGCLVFTVAVQLRGQKGRGFHTASLMVGMGLFLVTIFPIIYLTFQCAPQSLAITFQNQNFRAALGESLYTSTVSSIVVLFLGVPLAYGMARLEFSGKKILSSMIDLPILIPHSVAGIAILSAFGPKAPIGVWLIRNFGVEISNTENGIILAQIFVASPFLIRAAMNAFEAMGEEYENVARTLGAGPFRAFRTIALPLAAPAIIDGLILTWARAISEVASIIVVASEPKTLSVYTFDEFLRFGINEARPPAVLLIIICLWTFLCLRWIRSSAFTGGKGAAR